VVRARAPGRPARRLKKTYNSPESTPLSSLFFFSFSFFFFFFSFSFFFFFFFFFFLSFPFFFFSVRYGGESDVMWLGLYNACLLVGVLAGYGVGATASLDATASWQYYYGAEALLMLLCGVLYCFIDPALIQVVLRMS
jgi:hypothetical protein